MADIINLLPDGIANQIAAGEVVQRPASVVKELLENSVDAGARLITLLVREGGKEQIQVIDDGCGMSPMDARMCFERHATSKIHDAPDLEGIVTMGFRGEALASIAAVAEVSLCTAQEGSQVGTKLVMKGSQVAEQSSITTPKGANFLVRNLFFNVPARRRFLKSTSVEMKHVVAEFQRVALAHPTIAMRLFHGEEVIYDLPQQNRYKRIVQMFGRKTEKALIPIEIQTESVAIEGYICRPESARRRGGEQFFFANSRYMRHPYFHRAVLSAYDKIIAPDMLPVYFIFLTVPPESIDVNIHPTKTEIKFEHERIIWQILTSGVREALGQFGGVPELYFHEDPIRDMPFYPPSAPTASFEVSGAATVGQASQTGEQVIIPSRTISTAPRPAPRPQPGESGMLYGGLGLGLEARAGALRQTIPLGHGYFATPHLHGLAIIDQHRAHARVIYERLEKNPPNAVTSLQLLFPATVQLAPDELIGIERFMEEARGIGALFTLQPPDTLQLHAIPQGVNIADHAGFIRELHSQFHQEEESLGQSATRMQLTALAEASAYTRSSQLSPEQLAQLADDLLATREPAIDPKGRPTLQMLSMPQIQKMFQKG
ncbi:MAG: DNA mismatch repair protein MutL [Bacteroidia bacterium]|nr:MAG: DNA mismatch repair protein MutL [Bacteroidia bacterium]